VAKSIVLQAGDTPSAKQIVDTISRLRKDHAIMSRIKGKADIEDPESFRVVAGFLEMLLKREKNNLGGASTHQFMETMIDMVARHLLEMEGWELKQAVESTRLKEVLEKLK
jgi:hypothetical protein